MRIKIRLVCSVKIKDAEQPIPASIDDMSIAGARIQSKTLLGKLGDEFMVSFRIPLDGVDQLFVVPAIILNQGKDAENGSGETGLLTGLEFSQTDGSERNALQYFIYKNLMES